MFEIDFLKKQGLPTKSRPLDAALLAGIIAAAVVACCLLYIHYLENSSEIGSKQKRLAAVNSMLEKSSGQDSLTGRVKKNLAIYDECYFEIANSIGRYVQCTPILRELADLLPEPMLINELHLIRTISKEKVTSMLDAKKKVDYVIVNRMLMSDVYDFMPDAENTAVEKFLADWRKSPVMNSAFDNIYLAKSSDDEFKDPAGKSHKVKKHIINAKLKSQKITETQ